MNFLSAAWAKSLATGVDTDAGFVGEVGDLGVAELDAEVGAASADVEARGAAVAVAVAAAAAVSIEALGPDSEGRGSAALDVAVAVGVGADASTEVDARGAASNSDMAAIECVYGCDSECCCCL